jgi:hypothetical protein
MYTAVSPSGIVWVPSKGGIDRLTPPSLVSSDNKHWTAIYACVGGGTTSKPWHGRVP